LPLSKNYEGTRQKLRRDLATDPVKRDMYGRIHDHLTRLANEVELAMGRSETVTAAGGIDRQPTGNGSWPESSSFNGLV
jgi:hypothetical protein